jgi:hypothetical protein
MRVVYEAEEPNFKCVRVASTEQNQETLMRLLDYPVWLIKRIGALWGGSSRCPRHTMNRMNDRAELSGNHGPYLSDENTGFHKRVSTEAV